MTESIERHGGSAVARFGSSRTRAGQLNGDCTQRICNLCFAIASDFAIGATPAERASAR